MRLTRIATAALIVSLGATQALAQQAPAPSIATTTSTTATTAAAPAPEGPPGGVPPGAGPAGPATGAGTGPMPTADSTLGALADDPRSRPILDQIFPGLTGRPMFSMAREMTLKDVQHFAPDKITDDKIAEFGVALAAVH